MSMAPKRKEVQPVVEVAGNGKFKPRGLKQIKRVSKYITTDGAEHDTFASANHHQAEVDLEKSIEAFVFSKDCVLTVGERPLPDKQAAIDGILDWELDRRFNKGALTTRRKTK